MKKVETTFGYKLIGNGTIKYFGGHTNNGFVFKDADAWESGEGICYISEFGLEDYDEGVPANECGVTRKDIIDACYGKVKFAEYIFNNVDWQYIETLINDYVDYADEFYDMFLEFGFTKEEMKELFGVENSLA